MTDHLFGLEVPDWHGLLAWTATTNLLNLKNGVSIQNSWLVSLRRHE